MPTRSLAVAIFTVLAAVASIASAPPAAADRRTTYVHDYIQGFGTSGSYVMSGPSFCVRWRVGGVMRYRATVVKEVRSTTAPGTVAWGYSVSNVRLSTNQVEVNTYAARNGKCTTTRKKYSKLTLQEKMRGYSCSFSPQLSVGLPWSVAVGFWPSCGSRDLATMSATTEDDSSRFTMTSGAVVVSYKGKQDKGWYPSARSNLKWSCYGANARITVQTARASNNFDTPRIAICPGWNGSRSGW
ncbi:hypothetical protein [Pimelobacter simplex]|uniref:hypothetical protein n=1 Tax=Nocardioides simplex TaxID=2045 RepID=UPI00214FF203|nr:hypothetical protein [Pimelobacter simplex]UUW87663.1 hypothetical protein M0M43_18180 [Pimelobacter simplex]UUW97169.1 hypothetical protein M0M48_06830 [Pimelobacter simplex]